MLMGETRLTNLHSTAKTEDKVKGGLLLDVVVGEGAAVLELLAGEDQALLVRGDALLVLDLGLDIVDGVRRLHLKGDGLAREGLDEDLHDGLYLLEGKERKRLERMAATDIENCQARWIVMWG